MTNAIVEGDGKLLVFTSLVDWFSGWCETKSGLCLSSFDKNIACTNLIDNLTATGWLPVCDSAKLPTDLSKTLFLNTGI